MRKKNKTLKSAAVIFVTFIFAALFGIICFSRQHVSFMLPESRTIGIALAVAGAAIIIAALTFVIKNFVSFTRTRVVKSEETASDDSSSKESVKIKPIIITAVTALVGIMLFGLGFGMLFDDITLYILYLIAIAAMFFCIGIVFFVVSMKRREIKRGLAWIVAGICIIVSAVLIINTSDVWSDLNCSERDYIAVTGTVSSVRQDCGPFSGPGSISVTIKGTSGESITMRCSMDEYNFRVGERYTFYYRPNTHIIAEANKASK